MIYCIDPMMNKPVFALSRLLQGDLATVETTEIHLPEMPWAEAFFKRN